jgi:hypothetical protein
MKNLFVILFLTPSVFWGQTPFEPPHWADLGAVKKTFVANYSIPQFQTGEKGFQEWLKFELKDYQTIQKLIKKGDLEVYWIGHSQSADIKTSDSTAKHEIERVFKKMPLWYYGYLGWEDKSGQDTIFVDDTKKEYYKFAVPDNSFLFTFRLTDSLTYQYEGKNFSDTIQVTGGHLGFAKHEKIYSINDIGSAKYLATSFAFLIKKEVDKHFLLRKTYKLLALKEMDITVRLTFDVRIYIDATTKRAKRLSNRLVKLIHKKWRYWGFYKAGNQSMIRVRLTPYSGAWIYTGREY